jgi:RNA polymerase sigma factor (sigma-70 family)
MPTDEELLRRHAHDGSNDAFTELVQRHVGLVYHAASRQLGEDHHLADDVTQMVFTTLARKSSQLSGGPVLAGWLYSTTRNHVANVLRAERRRRHREHEAMRLSDVSNEAGTAAEWANLRPIVDQAVHALDSRDRNAILLRYFERMSFAEIGAILRVTDDAARMRVDRALQKMRSLRKGESPPPARPFPRFWPITLRQRCRLV